MQLSNNEMSYLKSIANMVDEFLHSKAPKMNKNHQLFKFMERSLPHLVPNKSFHVELVEITTSVDPFIMRVFPDWIELNNKSEELFTAMNNGKAQEFFKAYDGIRTFHIEIDERLLTKGQSLCVDDGNQFVGILCHEIGHVTFGNNLSLLSTYMECKQIYDKSAAMMMNKNPLVRKLCLPMFLASSSFKLVLKKATSTMPEEIMADSYVPDEYKGDLIAYFDNHVMNNPDKGKFLMSDEEYKSKQKTTCVFSRNIISNVKKRRKIMKSAFKAQYDTEDSPYLKKFVAWLGKDALGYDAETGITNEVYENSVLRCFELDNAACNNKAAILQEQADVTPRDISVLMVQVDDIQTSEQKLFCVHTIYDYMEILNAKKEKVLKKHKGNVEEAKRYTAGYDQQLDQLNTILKRVMSIDVSDNGKQYGLFIRYPKGYEG